MSVPDSPHRIVVDRIVYRRDPSRLPSASVERLGVDAEGRTVYVDDGRSASRKYLYLPSADPPLAAYVRDDPPPDYGIVDLLADAFLEPLPRPEALGLLGLLCANHVILADGTRLGGSRRALTEAVTTVALEPSGFAVQAERVPEWALAEALRPRADDLRARLLRVSFARAFGSPEFGFVRQITAEELVVARTSDQSVDVGARLSVSSPTGEDSAVYVQVVALIGRDARVAQVATDRREGVSHGDPVAFVADQREAADR